MCLGELNLPKVFESAGRIKMEFLNNRRTLQQQFTSYFRFQFENRNSMTKVHNNKRKRNKQNNNDFICATLYTQVTFSFLIFNEQADGIEKL